MLMLQRPLGRVAAPVRVKGKRTPVRVVGAAVDTTGSLHVSFSDALDLNRRRALILTVGAAISVPISFACAPRVRSEDVPAPPAFRKLTGYALPPESYMGYEQNSTYPPKYTIEYPTDWKVQKPTKTEKSTMGMDTRVHHPKADDVEAFVIALNGPDYRGVQLAKDPMDQLKAMATSDYDLREALSEASVVKVSQVQRQGTTFYLFDLEGEALHYLSSMAVDPKDGTMYALMARAPSGRAFSRSEGCLRHIQDTFTLL